MVGRALRGGERCWSVTVWGGLGRKNAATTERQPRGGGTPPSPARDVPTVPELTPTTTNTNTNTPAAPVTGGRISLLCVILSGGTDPAHPWRLPDYSSYGQLLHHAMEAGWSRPGQGDWRARVEEYEWCRDGRCITNALHLCPLPPSLPSVSFTHLTLPTK